MKPENVSSGQQADPVTLEDVERALEATRRAHEALTSMAEALGQAADGFQAVAVQLRARIREARPGRDAARWRPEEADSRTGVEHRCPLRGQHTWHPWTWTDPDTRSSVLVVCPGWPPETGLPVHWCRVMHRGTDHPGHIWYWKPDDDRGGMEPRSGESVRSMCPGWPLPPVRDIAPGG
jgi:hypothetical protein